MALAERAHLSVQSKDDELLAALEAAAQDPDEIGNELLATISDLRRDGVLADVEADALLQHVLAAMTGTQITHMVEEAFSPRALHAMTRVFRLG